MAAFTTASHVVVRDKVRCAGFTAGANWATGNGDRRMMKWFVNELALEHRYHFMDSLATRVWRELEDLASEFAESINDSGHDPDLWWEGFLHGVVHVWRKTRPLAKRGRRILL